MVTGTTNNSRLNELKKYSINVPFSQQFIGGGDWVIDGVDYNVSSVIEYVIYYIGGIQYLDETLIDGVHTSFKYVAQGTNSLNFIDVPYIKSPNKSRIISSPKIYDDVFIIRNKLSAFDKNYKLEFIQNLSDLTTYAGGKYFNIVKTI